MSYDSQTSTALVNKLRKDVDSLTLKIAVITDNKPSGTSGGAGVASSWTTRDLNTIDSDPNSLVLDLTSNQFTLAAGAYQIHAMAAFLHTGHTRMLLYDVTGGVAIGYSVSVEVSNQANLYNELNVRVQPHKDNVYRLEYYISTAGADHLGIAAGLTGISEIYAVCEITRLDTGMTKPTGGSGIQGAPGPAGPAGPAGPVGPAGSVTSVNGSGSTTGLSLTGGPITTTGTLTLGGTLALTNGGTGATSAGVALTNIGAYPSANPSGFTSNVGTVTSADVSGGTTGLTTSGGPITATGTITIAGTLAVTSGGTGAITAPAALTSLGAYPANNPNNYNVGTVTNVTVTPSNGITASVATSTTTPGISLGLGAITPTSVASTGTVTGTNLSGTHTGTSSGTNTGDQAIVLSGDITGSGSTGITTSIANSAVTLAKLATLSANSRLLGSTPSGTSVSELILGANLSITGNTLNAAGSGSGTVTSVAISGGTTGLTTSGSPITTSGTVTLGGNLAIANGGTGAATAGGALTTLGAYSNTNPSGFTSNVGTVTGTSITAANGVTGTVANQNTTPAITIILGAITPTSVAATGTVTGTNLSGTHTGTSSGTNTGDQNIALTGDVTGAGTTSFTATIANSAVTLSKLATLSANSRLLGSTPSGTSVSELILGTNLSITGNTINATGTGGGTVTSTSVTTANGVSGTVATATTTPAITLTLGAITPSSVAATGTVTGSNLSGTNTGNQTITLTGDVTGSGTGSFTATIGNNTVTYAKMQSASGIKKIVGSNASSSALTELTLGSNMSITGNVLNATGTGTGDVVGPASAYDGYLALYDGVTGKLIKQGVWRDQGDDLIGPAGSGSMTEGFVYIPTDTTVPSGSPTNNTPGAKNSPMYFRSNTLGYYQLWIHDGATWRGVDLPLT